jgi:hypothetical protein
MRRKDWDIPGGWDSSLISETGKIDTKTPPFTTSTSSDSSKTMMKTLLASAGDLIKGSILFFSQLSVGGAASSCHESERSMASVQVAKRARPAPEFRLSCPRFVFSSFTTTWAFLRPSKNFFHPG